MKELVVTVLIENTVNSRGLLAEHGLSFHIKKDGQSFIFDTGQGLGLKHNCQELGVDLGNVSSVILSHGHYDHTGGIGTLLDINPGLTFRGHPNLLYKKFKVQDKEAVEIGIPEELKDRLSERIIFNKDTVEIEDCIYLSGEITTSHLSKQNENFKIWIDEYVEDTFMDEQALFIKTPLGLVVFSGCSHKGIAETLQFIKKITGEKIYAVLGGLHLNSSTDNEIKKTGEKIEELEVDYLGLCHCTGLKAYCYFKNKFKEKVFPCPAGSKIHLIE